MKRTHEQAVADLRHLSAHRFAALGQVAEQLAFDSFSALFDVEQIFDPTAQSARKLEGDRGGGGVWLASNAETACRVIPARSASCFCDSASAWRFSRRRFSISI